MRVVVYNVRGFRDGLERVVGVVRPLRARPGPAERDRQPALAPAVREGARDGGRRATRGRRFRRRMKRRGAGPAAVADRRAPAAPVRPTSARPCTRGARSSRTSGARGGGCAAIAIHLGLHPLERLARGAGARGPRREGSTAPVLVGGDCNETPDGRAMAFLAERFWDAWLLGGDVGGGDVPGDRPDGADRLPVRLGGARRSSACSCPRSCPRRATASDHLPGRRRAHPRGPGESGAGRLGPSATEETAMLEPGARGRDERADRGRAVLVATCTCRCPPTARRRTCRGRPLVPDAGRRGARRTR